jgi:hypothetical protein
VNYIKPTILVGFILPAILIGMAAWGVWYGVSWVGNTYQVRAAAFAQLQADKSEEKTLREEVLPHKGAIAYFEGIKSESVEEKLPPYVSEICDGEFDGMLIRNSLDFQGEDGVSINLTGRYDAMQKFIARLGARFLFLETESINLSASEADSSIPSRHVVMNYTAKGQKGDGGADSGDGSNPGETGMEGMQ